jgi:serine protease AprX
MTSPAGNAGDVRAYLPDDLLQRAKENRSGALRVIVQTRSAGSGAALTAIDRAKKLRPGRAAGLKRRFSAIPAAAAELTGEQVEELARDSNVLAVTEDAPISATGYANGQNWVPSTEFRENETNPWTANKGYTYPAIAIVDSGVQPRSDFGSRLLTSVSFVSTGFNSSGDGFGHGTLVAGIAAGSADGYTGVAPRAKLVSLDVLNDLGAGYMSDAIAAADWILANKAQYNIRVANFSINASGGASVLFDPLDRAVEKLWLNGVVVVASVGNYASNGAQSGVLFSPANDPFVITVGASDVNGDGDNENDFAAPWSAWGYTYDGFFKPEIAAPGRQITSAVPSGSTLATLFPTRMSGSSYMWMSGTSFAAPMVSGAAAWFLTKYPSWTPDQVKGALMLDVDVPDGYTPGGQLGLGVLDADGEVGTTSPPNPNAALNQFVSTDPATGLKVFDAASWASAAAANASWSSASWANASWANASWSSASWANASWANASWSSASWSSASWANASWANLTPDSIGVE